MVKAYPCVIGSSGWSQVYTTLEVAISMLDYVRNYSSTNTWTLGVQYAECNQWLTEPIPVSEDELRIILSTEVEC